MTYVSGNIPDDKKYINKLGNISIYCCTSKNVYNMYRGWTKIDYQDKHCITDQTDKGT